MSQDGNLPVPDPALVLLQGPSLPSAVRSNRLSCELCGAHGVFIL